MSFLPIGSLRLVDLDAVVESGLVLPYGEYDTGHFLIAWSDSPQAIFLDGEWAFSAFPASEGGNWHGLFLPNVDIRVDVSSAFDASRGSVPRGAIIKTPESSYISATTEGRGGYPSRIKFIIDGAKEAQPFFKSAGFTRWTIGHILDESWVPLFEVDVTTK